MADLVNKGIEFFNRWGRNPVTTHGALFVFSVSAAEKQHVEVNAQVQRPRQLRQHCSNTHHPWR
jgi:hypothetical protein